VIAAGELSASLSSHSASLPASLSGPALVGGGGGSVLSGISAESPGGGFRTGSAVSGGPAPDSEDSLLVAYVESTAYRVPVHTRCAPRLGEVASVRWR
jgi:hypothetical protein